MLHNIIFTSAGYHISHFCNWQYANFIENRVVTLKTYQRVSSFFLIPFEEQEIYCIVITFRFLQLILKLGREGINNRFEVQGKLRTLYR